MLSPVPSRVSVASGSTSSVAAVDRDEPRLRILITVKKRMWCGELQTIVLGANGFAARGHRVIVAHNRESSVVKHLDTDRVHLVEFDFQRSVRRWPRYWPTMRRLRRLIRDERIDVVEAHASWDHWLCASALTGMRDRPPLVRFRHNRKRVQRHFANRWLYRRTDRFVTQTEQVRSDVLDTGFVPERRVTVLGSSVDLDRFRPDPDARSRVRAVLGIPHDAEVIGYVGRLSERKRTDRLPEIHSLVARLRPSARLVVIGWGDRPYEQSVEDAARRDPRVLFLGRRSDPESLYPAFDAFVLASHSESFPRAAIEAMACGVPTVTGHDSGLGRFVEDGVHGRVLADDSAPAFAAALDALWAAPEAAAEMAQRGRRLVNESLTVEAYVDRFERLLLDVAAPRLTASPGRRRPPVATR